MTVGCISQWKQRAKPAYTARKIANAAARPEPPYREARERKWIPPSEPPQRRPPLVAQGGKPVQTTTSSRARAAGRGGFPVESADFSRLLPTCAFNVPISGKPEIGA